MVLSKNVRERLRCPACHSTLRSADDALTCAADACATRFPIVDGIPVLIDDDASFFKRSDLEEHKATTVPHRRKLARAIDERLPLLSLNLKAEANYDAFIRRLLARDATPVVLVLGGGLLGCAMDVLLSMRSIELVETDIAIRPRTRLICDAHDLPFADASFDGVIITGVLDDLLDPHRCVDEIHRVLRAEGVVYAETPFMQPVHSPPFDFVRFTRLGHRRLFRRFDEIASGPVSGPGAALAKQYSALLKSFALTPTTRFGAHIFSHLTGFWLKYLDRWVIDNPGASDAAAGFYFLGAKSDRALSDRELIDLYRGP